ncbi:hypothetical protein [Luedemannella flava]|uniref:hypothetical protein n=1 Tax=Luedemannella flava TaxID=349316 RepID=UPI0031DDE645
MTSRLVLALAVFTGLMAMHGVSPPMSAACVAGTSTSKPVAEPGHTMAHGGAAAHAPAASSGSVVALDHDGGHGDMCVATVPRSPLTMMAAAAVLLGIMSGLAGADLLDAPFRQRRASRASPWGAALLIRLCVSRT